jgi:DNA-binding transcriptional regulator LsrR (DeoR family)
MKKKLDTDDVIENLITATLGEEATARQLHIFRENLHSLVRLAKAEQVVEIKANVRRLAGVLEAHSARRRTKALLMAQRLPGILDQAQQQFEFKQ